MTLLDDFYVKLQTVGSSSVTEFASFSDERLNFSNPGDIRIFIPDLHLISSRGRQAMHADGPHPSHELLKNVLKATTEFRTDVKANDSSTVCAVYFMGDTFDLWREAPPGSSVPATVQSIAKEHQEFLELACSADLQAFFILGNHDFELNQAAAFTAADRRHYFPPANSSVVALHGDVFDWIEDFPDAWNEVAVYYFGPLLRDVTKIRAKIAKFLKIDKAPPPSPAEPLAVCGDHAQAQEHHELWNRAWQAISESNAKYELALHCVVIGHTHTPRIAVLDTDDEFLALVDVGGWVEDIRDNNGGKEVGMIGAMCANEVRLFQISAI